jgi:hypothetical protein
VQVEDTMFAVKIPSIKDANMYWPTTNTNRCLSMIKPPLLAGLRNFRDRGYGHLVPNEYSCHSLHKIGRELNFRGRLHCDFAGPVGISIQFDCDVVFTWRQLKDCRRVTNEVSVN